MPSELPHASSKVFDEGDLPVPAKFKKLRAKKPLLKTSSEKKQQRMGKIVPEISTLSERSESAFSESDFGRSRVKDHIKRFIRQS